jgi:hypothetical protein
MNLLYFRLITIFYNVKHMLTYMELIDSETDKLLQDLVKWCEDQDKDLIRILQNWQAEQDALLFPLFEMLAAEDTKLL